MRHVSKICHVHALFDNPISDLEVDYPFNGEFSVVGSCNGLLCMSMGYDTLCVWNPSTRKSNYLPSFEKKLDTRVYGFGYDESKDDYKVVAVYSFVSNRDWHDTSVMIYSLKTGKWKEIGVFPNGYSPLFQPSRFLNGALHWVAAKGRSCTIISLDLGKETCGEVLQREYDEGYKALTLGDLKEWLCVCCSYGETRMDIWVMKVYGVEVSWTKLVSISCPTKLGMSLFFVRFYISHDGMFLLRCGSKLIVYNSKNDSSSKYFFQGYFQAWTYVESLVSPMPLAGLQDRDYIKYRLLSQRGILEAHRYCPLFAIDNYVAKPKSFNPYLRWLSN